MPSGAHILPEMMDIAEHYSAGVAFGAHASRLPRPMESIHQVSRDIHIFDVSRVDDYWSSPQPSQRAR
jgi:hypothetical protein